MAEPHPIVWRVAVVKGLAEAGLLSGKFSVGDSAARIVEAYDDPDLGVIGTACEPAVAAGRGEVKAEVAEQVEWLMSFARIQQFGYDHPFSQTLRRLYVIAHGDVPFAALNRRG